MSVACVFCVNCCGDAALGPARAIAREPAKRGLGVSRECLRAKRSTSDAKFAFHAERSPGPRGGGAGGVRSSPPVRCRALPWGLLSPILAPAGARGHVSRSMRPECGCWAKAVFLVSREGRGRGFSLGYCLAIYFGPLSSTAGVRAAPRSRFLANLVESAKHSCRAPRSPAIRRSVRERLATSNTRSEETEGERGHNVRGSCSLDTGA